MKSVEHGMYRFTIMIGQEKNCRKVKRGFKTKRETVEWKYHLRIKEIANLYINQLCYNM